MSVQTEIDRIISAVGAAYDAVEAKGGASPQSKTIENLAEAVKNIPSGSDITLGLTGTAVGQVPAVKTIDEQGQPTQWEATALPDEAFIVYFTLERPLVGDPTITSDRTLEEVVAAIAAKKQVIALLDENNDITQLCSIARTGSYLYFFTIGKNGDVVGIGWKIEIDISGEKTYTLTTMEPWSFIGYDGVSGSNQIFGTGETGGYEFKQHISFENLPEVTTSDNGKFMRVLNGAWEAGESDFFICAVTTSGSSYTCDKTSAQILAAASAGKIPIAIYNNAVYFLAGGSQMFAKFTRLSSSTSEVLTVTMSGTASFQTVTLQTVPSRSSIDAPSQIKLVDNAEYYLTNVGTVTFAFPAATKFECWMRITTVASGTITVTFPATVKYIGEAPTFSAGETWELSVKDGVVIAMKETT